MFVIKHRAIFIGISLFLIVASIVGLLTWGLRIGIDFKGGSLTEVAYPGGLPDVRDIESRVLELDYGSAVIQPIGENGLSIKTRDLTEPERQALVNTLNSDGTVEMEERSFTSIGPSVGNELKTKSVISLIIVAVTMIIFVAYAFRKVSKPISGWKYGFITVVALIHDVILTAGVFTLISHFTGAEADTLFVVALLTVLGLSVNDTIVVFDRVRENLLNKTSPHFPTVVGKSLNQTMLRSLNTSLSVIIVLVALFVFGPDSTRIFALTLACGMFFGTYSSIFIASPLLVIVEGLQKKREVVE
jgi:preprotein translocase subunit SecF